ncbi:hypothetical protein SAMN04488515_0621 [Cognatiyoonia koreensis]|uniref:Uncharacterized protein n=1 Tax=Cognatiyoonia koreensis TaxID=364200 RepID=A0A1I0NHS6_9RHOB|nr:hypothetical protein [Cognatiyoonia koreensis]SEW00780.1 hypothetical protein SAMN04488515_0621 [Cognatiyoonia koreensis]
MTRIIFTALAALSISGTAALACTTEDVQARQDALVAAVQALVATDPAKAQSIVLKMQQDMDAAAANNDDEAVCQIMDEALAAAQE